MALSKDSPVESKKAMEALCAEVILMSNSRRFTALVHWLKMTFLFTVIIS